MTTEKTTSRGSERGGTAGKLSEQGPLVPSPAHAELVPSADVTAADRLRPLDPESAAATGGAALARGGGVDHPADSRLRRLIRFFDPAEPDCLRRIVRLVTVLFLAFGCLACGGGLVFSRSETGRYLALFILYHNWLHEPCVQRADRLIRDYPTSNWHYYRIKAACLRRMGRFEESLAVYDEAIRALPDNWWPYSHRCYYRGLLDDPQAVLADCDRSIELAPDDMVVALDRRAMIRALVGDREGAIADFEEALDLSKRRVRGAYSSELRAIREGWLQTLREGGNPLTRDAIWDDLAAYGTPRQ